LAVLFVLLVAVGGVAAAVYWPTPRRQALDRVEQLGGSYIDETADDDGTGLRRVVSVVLVLRPATDDDLPVLRHIRPLHRVLLDGSKVTNAGLAHLQAIEELEWISVCDTAVTDAGLANLRGHPGLRMVHFRRCKVTDTGMGYLKDLPKLVHVNCAETQVTDAGADALRRAFDHPLGIYLHPRVD
jgi:hypothetical protein